MKKLHINSKIATVTAIITIALFSIIALQSCTKESTTDSCAGISCLNGGTCSKGICNCPTGYTGIHCETKATTNIVINNNSFTDIVISRNSVVQTIPISGNITYSGSYGDAFSATASTFAKTTTGVQVGYAINWTIDDVFPAMGNTTKPLDVLTNAFFLKIKNNGTTQITKLYVDYGLSDQHLDNITFPNDGQVYNIGYYPSTTVNFRAEDASGAHWDWNTIQALLPMTKNQSIVLTAN